MKRDTIFVALILVLFFLLCMLPKLNLPGLGGDESNGPRTLIQMLQYPSTMPQSAFQIRIFGKVFPILDRPYQSSLYTYLYLPFAYIGGINIYTIRIAHIFYGLIILILYYVLIKNLSGPKKALIALSLIATFPSFVLGIKTDAEYYIYVIPILIVLLFFLKFYETKKISYFCLSSFMFGVGIYYGFMFWIFAISSLLILLICHFKIRINRRYVILGLFFVLLGSSPLIYYNLKNGETIKYILSPFLKNYVSVHSPFYVSQIVTIQSDTKANPDSLQKFTNLHDVKLIQQNIITRIKTLKNIIIGLNFDIKGLFPWNFSFFNLFMILSALVLSIFKVISQKTSKNEKVKIKVILCFLVFFILLSSLTSPSFLRDHQMFIIIPLLFALSADFIDFLYKKWNICAILVLLAIISVNLVITKEMHNNLFDYGFFSPEHPSDSIYALGKYICENKIVQPINIGVGHGRSDFQNNIFVLTGGSSWPFNLFRTEDNKKYFTNFVKNPENVYVLPAASIEQADKKSNYGLFKTYVEETNKTLVIEKIFTDRAGESEFIVYKLK